MFVVSYRQNGRFLLVLQDLATRKDLSLWPWTAERRWKRVTDWCD